MVGWKPWGSCARYISLPLRSTPTCSTCFRPRWAAAISLAQSSSSKLTSNPRYPTHSSHIQLGSPISSLIFSSIPLNCIAFITNDIKQYKPYLSFDHAIMYIPKVLQSSLPELWVLHLVTPADMYYLCI